MIFKNIERDSLRFSTDDKTIENLLENIIVPHIRNISEYNWQLIKNHYDIISYSKGGSFKKHRDYRWYYAPNRIQMTLLVGLSDAEGGGTQIWYPKDYTLEEISKTNHNSKHFLEKYFYLFTVIIDFIDHLFSQGTVGSNFSQATLILFEDTFFDTFLPCTKTCYDCRVLDS